ncbi:unnamed protein product [marine sediment metagenome]|uniref:Uncharacterized protein n=1 Tax=marine sediment metagenome TaxID=412755 RepID=X1SEH1_9ZZZZ
MKQLRGLLLKPTLSLLSWILRRNGNSVIIGGPLGWSWESSIDAAHHGSLVGPADAHRHSDMANIGPDNHHSQLHPTEHQDGGLQEISIAGLSGEPAELTTHKGLPDVHHTKFTITEHDVVARHPLAVLDPAVCSETEADNKIRAVINSGTYTGDDESTRRIAHGLGVTPRLVLVIENNANLAGVITGTQAMEVFTDGSGLIANWDTTHFEADNWEEILFNSSGKVYYWVAFA